MMRDDDNPPDTITPHQPLSMPPKNWLTFRLVLIVALVFIDVLGLVGEWLGEVKSESLANLLFASAGGVMGALTSGGGGRK